MSPNFNLVLCHIPERQQVSDYLTIRNMMVGRAPDIDVHVISLGENTPAEFWQRMAARPTLIFCIGEIRIAPSIRGTRLISKNLSKVEEMRLIGSAGFSVPEAHLLTPELRLDARDWGAYTVIKPNGGIRGRGVKLTYTRDVRWTDTTALPESDPHYGQQLVAQRFVDTGRFASSYRVMTFLGRPVYCAVSTAAQERSELSSLPPIAANGMERRLALSFDEDVIRIAAKLHAALPDRPVMGVDVIRETATGKLYVLEFNSHGLVWHLSSKLGYSQQRENGIDFYGQFHALETIADALIDATRKMAA